MNETARIPGNVLAEEKQVRPREEHNIDDDECGKAACDAPRRKYFCTLSASNATLPTTIPEVSNEATKPHGSRVTRRTLELITIRLQAPVTWVTLPFAMDDWGGVEARRVQKIVLDLGSELDEGSDEKPCGPSKRPEN